MALEHVWLWGAVGEHLTASSQGLPAQKYPQPGTILAPLPIAVSVERVAAEGQGEAPVSPAAR